MNKKQNKQTIHRVRNKLHAEEIYYTNSQWNSNIIDGIEFIPIVKTLDDMLRPIRSNVFYMRKDVLEFIKEK